MPRAKTTSGCRRCKRELPVAEFDRYLFQGKPHGLRQVCRACEAARDARPPVEPPNPSGLCMCGCREPAPIAPQTCRRRGWVAGLPLRFIPGHQTRKSPIEYIVDDVTGCWVWQQGKSSGGYGMKWVEVDGVKTRVYAHRLVYERHRGPVPEGLVLDHVKERCGRRDCVNPAHLEPVTTAENIRRGARAKLSHEAAVEIRALWPDVSSRELANQFGVHISTIQMVVNGKAWARSELT